MAENRITKKTKFFTVLAVTLLFVLVLLLVTLLIQRAQLIRAKAELEEKISQCEEYKESLNEKLDECSTLEWIEQRARELGMIDKDGTLGEMK